MASLTQRSVVASVRKRWLESSLRRQAMDRREVARHVTWPETTVRPANTAARVGIVVVNWNTRRLIAQLIFSLYRILGAEHVHRLVVVDNGSTDGSREMLAALERAGLVRALLNQHQRYHGPALNQGVSLLAAQQAQAPAADQLDYVWILDSDVVVLRADTVRNAVAHLEQTQSAVVGPGAWNPTHGQRMLSIYSLLLDPTVAWRRPLPPFFETGEPSAALQIALQGAGKTLAPFPFVEDGYLVHVGRGTLAHLAQARASGNRYREWARDHHEPHFTGEEAARARYAAFVDLFDEHVPTLTNDALIKACRETHALVVS